MKKFQGIIIAIICIAAHVLLCVLVAPSYGMWEWNIELQNTPKSLVEPAAPVTGKLDRAAELPAAVPVLTAASVPEGAIEPFRRPLPVAYPVGSNQLLGKNWITGLSARENDAAPTFIRGAGSSSKSAAHSSREINPAALDHTFDDVTGERTEVVDPSPKKGIRSALRKPGDPERQKLGIRFDLEGRGHKAPDALSQVKDMMKSAWSRFKSTRAPPERERLAEEERERLAEEEKSRQFVAMRKRVHQVLNHKVQRLSGDEQSMASKFAKVRVLLSISLSYAPFSRCSPLSA